MSRPERVVGLILGFLFAGVDIAGVSILTLFIYLIAVLTTLTVVHSHALCDAQAALRWTDRAAPGAAPRPRRSGCRRIGGEVGGSDAGNPGGILQRVIGSRRGFILHPAGAAHRGGRCAAARTGVNQPW